MISERGFCEHKFHTMLLTGTFTMAVIYIMMLCDTVIAGLYIGEKGVAAVNAVVPTTNLISFFSSIIAIGSAILYSREIGAMRKDRADEIFGQGVILSVFISVLSALILIAGRNLYFAGSGIIGEIYDLALGYYKWTPLNAVLSIAVMYLSEMVYTDGDEICNNVSYVGQIVVKIASSLLLVRMLGIEGIMLGTVIGNLCGGVLLVLHFFRKSNTLRFKWHLSLNDLISCMRFSIVDSAIYLCWAVANFIMIGHISSHYSESELVILAVVISVIEFTVVMDGVGMAIQPLLGTYFGEKNNILIRRLMQEAFIAALIEGILANLVVLVFARQFCLLFGITDETTLDPAVSAVRIVATGLIFCSMISLTTSYYMLIDRVALSVGITVLKEGVMYSILPLLGSMLFGEAGLWAAFAIAPLFALGFSFLYIRVRYGRESFPYQLEESENEIVVLDSALTPDGCAQLSQKIDTLVRERNYPNRVALSAALFAEEIGLTVIEKNADTKKKLLVEVSLFFGEDSVLLIVRDSGVVFDITDPDMQVGGLSSFVLSGLMKAQDEKANLTTTGYNRNMMRFARTDQVISNAVQITY